MHKKSKPPKPATAGRAVNETADQLLALGLLLVSICQQLSASAQDSLATGDLAAAKNRFGNSADLARKTRASAVLVRSLLGLARVAELEGNRRQEVATLGRALRAAAASEDREGESLARLMLAGAARRDGDLKKAGDLLKQILETSSGSGELPVTAAALQAYGGLSVELGRNTFGTRLLAAGHAGLEKAGASWISRSARQAARDDINKARKALGPKKFRAAWERGAAMSSATSVAYANTGERKLGDKGWPSLSTAEMEVMELVLKGLSYKEVAAQLFVVPKTVQGHMRNIFDKLDVHSRGELAKLAQQGQFPHLSGPSPETTFQVRRPKTRN